MENPENEVVKPEEAAGSKDNKNKNVMEKGNCLECSHYNDCPRMKGINRCYSMHIVKPDDLNEEISRFPQKPSGFLK
jgi:hypothetical protein